MASLAHMLLNDVKKKKEERLMATTPLILRYLVIEESFLDRSDPFRVAMYRQAAFQARTCTLRK